MEYPVYYLPHDKQTPFHESKAKFRILCTGVGFGKTAAGVNELIKQMLNSKPGTWYALAAPTYRMLTTVTIREFFKFCPRELIKNYNRSDQIITLINDVSVIGVAGDREDTIDRARGLTIGGFYGDEIAGSREYMHEVLIARLRDSGGCLRGWYTTTPKGFNWLYRIFAEKTNKKGEPVNNPEDFEIFTGTSYDNPFTPEEYKKTLESAYSGAFKKQEILGEFVGFEGLVYPEFSRNTHIQDVAYYLEKYPYVIAGVDWGYTNPSVIVVMAVTNDDGVVILEEFYERRMMIEQLLVKAEELRHKYQIKTFYCDPSEPQFIAQFNRKGLRAVPANNSILPGISAVAKRIQIIDNRTNLIVNSTCKNVIKEFETYRYSDTAEDKPDRDVPLKVDDHCFAKGTQVYTSKGNRNIEDIKAGEYVLTRKGFKKVLWSGLTKKKANVVKAYFNNGQYLIGTPEHLVYSNLGWVRIDALRYVYKLQGINDNIWFKYITKDCCIQNGTEDIIDGQIERPLNISTEKYGKPILAKYPKDISFITKMRIKLITVYQILKYLLQNNIIINILKNIQKNILIKLDLLQRYGTPVKKVENGILNTERISGKIANKLKRIVNYAAKGIIHIVQREQSSAIRIVKLKPYGQEDVYNLHIEDCHEFYANGILVHNCMDAIRYAIISLERVKHTFKIA